MNNREQKKINKYINKAIDYCEEQKYKEFDFGRVDTEKIKMIHEFMTASNHVQDIRTFDFILFYEVSLGIKKSFDAQILKRIIEIKDISGNEKEIDELYEMLAFPSPIIHDDYAHQWLFYTTKLNSASPSYRHYCEMLYKLFYKDEDKFAINPLDIKTIFMDLTKELSSRMHQKTKCYYYSDQIKFQKQLQTYFPEMLGTGLFDEPVISSGKYVPGGVISKDDLLKLFLIEVGNELRLVKLNISYLLPVYIDLFTYDIYSDGATVYEFDSKYLENYSEEKDAYTFDDVYNMMLKINKESHLNKKVYQHKINRK